MEFLNGACTGRPVEINDFARLNMTFNSCSEKPCIFSRDFSSLFRTFEDHISRLNEPNIKWVEAEKYKITGRVVWS